MSQFELFCGVVLPRCRGFAQADDIALMVVDRFRGDANACGARRRVGAAGRCDQYCSSRRVCLAGFGGGDRL